MFLNISLKNLKVKSKTTTFSQFEKLAISQKDFLLLCLPGGDARELGKRRNFFQQIIKNGYLKVKDFKH